MSSRNISTRPSWRNSSAGMSYVPADAKSGDGFAKLKKAIGNSDVIRVFYLAVAPALVRRHLRQAQGAHARHAEFAHRRGKADRPRSRLGARAQRSDRRRFRRAPDLPHRPLSRQGDGAEPDGAALRQRALRAVVELGAYRPCADHRGRDRRAGGSRHLLRHGRRAARHGAEPHAAAGLPGRHGGAVVDGRQRRARREAEGADTR